MPTASAKVRRGRAEFRTAPLWGLGQRIFFLHDGRTSTSCARSRSTPAATRSTTTPRKPNGVISNFNGLRERAEAGHSQLPSVALSRNPQHSEPAPARRRARRFSLTPEKQKPGRGARAFHCVESGTDLLSRGIPRTIIGAAPFHGPVRDGKAWFQSALGTRHSLSLRCFHNEANSKEAG